jgi:hypothetical protein
VDSGIEERHQLDFPEGIDTCTAFDHLNDSATGAIGSVQSLTEMQCAFQQRDSTHRDSHFLEMHHVYSELESNENEFKAFKS